MCRKFGKFETSRVRHVQFILYAINNLSHINGAYNQISCYENCKMLKSKAFCKHSVCNLFGEIITKLELIH